MIKPFFLLLLSLHVFYLSLRTAVKQYRVVRLRLPRRPAELLAMTKTHAGHHDSFVERIVSRKFQLVSERNQIRIPTPGD